MNKLELIEKIYGKDFGETDSKKTIDFLINAGYPNLCKIIYKNSK